MAVAKLLRNPHVLSYGTLFTPNRLVRRALHQIFRIGPGKSRSRPPGEPSRRCGSDRCNAEVRLWRICPSAPPGAHAGTLDLMAGTTLIIPVHVAGALFEAATAMRRRATAPDGGA